MPNCATLSRFKLVTFRFLVAALLIGAAGNATNGQVVFDDANGNASNSGAAPTSINLLLGSNIVNGTVTSPANTRNFYTFNIGANEQLSAIELLTLNVTTATGGPSSDPGFFALVSGTTSATPAAGVGVFPNLGGELFDPSDLNTNLLLEISGGGITDDGTGFSTLGQGDYTFVIQQTGDEISNFSLDFQVTSVAIPEPTSGIALAALGLTGLVRRRR